MTDTFGADLVPRRPAGSDHRRVLAATATWWGDVGGRSGPAQRAALLPRLFFDHFADTSVVVETRDGDLLGFLIGFVSPSVPGLAYVHFTGVAPSARRYGLAATMYRWSLPVEPASRSASRAPATGTRSHSTPRSVLRRARRLDGRRMRGPHRLRRTRARSGPVQQVPQLAAGLSRAGRCATGGHKRSFLTRAPTRRPSPCQTGSKYEDVVARWGGVVTGSVLRLR